MQAVKIGPDMSTATGIQRRIEQRIQELKQRIQSHDETENSLIVDELVALREEIEQGIDDMINDMEREHQERAREKEIRMHDAGITEDDIKLRIF